MLQIKQLIYKYPDDTDKSTSVELKDGFFGKDIVSSVLGKNTKILTLGIQAKPKTIFIINGSTIIIGPTGIYELTGLPITSLICSEDNHIANSRIVIDMIYEKEE